MFGRRQPDERGELPGIVEARQVPQLGDDRDRHHPAHAAQRLQRFDHRIQTPGRGHLEELLFDPLQSIDLLVDREDRFLKHDLL